MKPTWRCFKETRLYHPDLFLLLEGLAFGFKEGDTNTYGLSAGKVCRRKYITEFPSVLSY
jgi:hypothetical protein